MAVAVLNSGEVQPGVEEIMTPQKHVNADVANTRSSVLCLSIFFYRATLLAIGRTKNNL